MYQYSLKYFTQVFNTVIETSEKREELQERLNILYDEITLSVYTNVSRGLFERHKLVFSFMVCAAIFQQCGVIEDAHWNYLLRGPVGAKQAVPKKPDYPTVTEAMWVGAHFLGNTFKCFAGLPGEMLNVIRIRIGRFEQVKKSSDQNFLSHMLNVGLG